MVCRAERAMLLADNDTSVDIFTDMFQDLYIKLRSSNDFH